MDPGDVVDHEELTDDEGEVDEEEAEDGIDHDELADDREEVDEVEAEEDEVKVVTVDVTDELVPEGSKEP